MFHAAVLNCRLHHVWGGTIRDSGPLGTIVVARNVGEATQTKTTVKVKDVTTNVRAVMTLV
jgi:hypothetical protein